MDRRLVLSKQNRDLFRMALGRFFAPKWAAGFSRGFNPELIHNTDKYLHAFFS